jgi:GTP-binding protein HflX
VLQEIGAGDVQQVLVFNKLDAIEPERQPRKSEDFFEIDPGRNLQRVYVSARDGSGLDTLRRIIADVARPLLDAPQLDGFDPGDPRGAILVDDPADIHGAG